MPKINKNDASSTIDLATAAKLAKCTPRWVQKMVADGFIPRPERGRYTVVGVVHGRIDSLQAEIKRASKTAAHSRVQEERALEIKQRRLERDCELIEFAEHISVVDEIIGIFRSEMSGVPARVTRDVEWRKKIENELDDICRRASKRFEQRSQELRKGGEVGYIEDDADEWGARR